ncbi:MAG: hypothetical protein WKF37_24845 [Bryobacteraceae bacterium]
MGRLARLTLAFSIIAATLAAEGPRDLLSRVPRYFEPAGDSNFISRGYSSTLLLQPNRLVLGLAETGAQVEMKFAGGRAQAEVRAEEPFPGRSNYFSGSAPGRWRTGVPHFGRVVYSDVYPGIDVVYYGNGQHLEYDLVLAPGADAKLIRLRFSGIRKLSIDALGDLVLDTGKTSIRQRRPLIYQQDGDSKREIAGRYLVRPGNEVTFELAEHDTSRPLVIDPVLQFSTFFGGTGTESAFSVKKDAAKNIYLSGITTSPGLPLLNPVQPTLAGGSDAFVAKFSPAGTLLYATYIGGSGNEINPTRRRCRRAGVSLRAYAFLQLSHYGRGYSNHPSRQQ